MKKNPNATKIYFFFFSPNILSTPEETVQSKKQKICEDSSPNISSVAPSDPISEINEISSLEPLDEPENLARNPDFVIEIESVTSKSSISAAPITSHQESPILETPNTPHNESINIAINPSCDSGVFTMDMDSENSISESPSISFPLSKQFRRIGLDIYYCMRCKENDIADTKGHSCWKSRRRRQEILKPPDTCSPCYKNFERYDNVPQTFDNNQNLTSVM